MISRRLTLELENYNKNPIPGIKLEKINEDLFHWRATVLVLKDSPYKGGTYLLDIFFSNEYPFQVPEITFITKIYNIYVNFNGKISKYLFYDWYPKMNCAQLIEYIFSCMIEPKEYYIDDDIKSVVYNIYKTDKKKYNKLAYKWSIKYANAPCEIYNLRGNERLNYELDNIKNKNYLINKDENGSKCSVIFLCPKDSPFENNELKIDFDFKDYPNTPPEYYIQSLINNIHQKLIEIKIYASYVLFCKEWNEELFFEDILDLFHKSLNYKYFWDDLNFSGGESFFIEIIQELQNNLLMLNKYKLNNLETIDDLNDLKKKNLKKKKKINKK